MGEAVLYSPRSSDVDDFAALYARARGIGYGMLFDQILDIADTPQIGTKTITRANGEVQTIVGDMIEHRRLQIDSRKWMLAKALPKIYGDKLTAEVTGKDGAPLEQPSVRELARDVAFIFATGLQEQEEAKESTQH